MSVAWAREGGRKSAQIRGLKPHWNYFKAVLARFPCDHLVPQSPLSDSGQLDAGWVSSGTGHLEGLTAPKRSGAALD
jgi:hypothetical protein